MSLRIFLTLCFGVLGVGKAWEYGEGIIFTLKIKLLAFNQGVIPF